MTLYDLFDILNLPCPNRNKKINKIEFDSRNIQKNDIFIAIKGNNYDGNDFIVEAIKKGAIYCITDKDINNKKCIKVLDIKKLIFDLTNYIRCKYNIPLIAITGSNGKTTTKELIYQILKSKYNILKSEGNNNNIYGVSKTLFNLDEKYDLILLELGSNHSGEISYLSKMCNPTYSIITNIGTSHIGNFKSRKNIFKEKISILDGMKEKKLIVNGDDKYLKKLNYYKCGINYGNNLVAYNIRSDYNKLNFNIHIDSEYEVEFNYPIMHFINDILLAIKTALDFNIDMKDIVEGIKNFNNIDMRMNIIKTSKYVIINDCYNSSFESLKGGINYLKTLSGNKIIILGDILELGSYSKKIHKKVNRYLRPVKDSLVLTKGEYTKYINGIHFKNNADIIEYLKGMDLKGKYIYVKGSRKMKLEEIVKYLLIE